MHCCVFSCVRGYTRVCHVYPLGLCMKFVYAHVHINPIKDQKASVIELREMEPMTQMHFETAIC